MIEATKDIVIALINNKQIANQVDATKNVDEVKTAIKEICNELKLASKIKVNDQPNIYK